MPNQSGYSPDVHVRIKVNGNGEKRDFLDYVLGKLDVDWPYAPVEFRREGQEPPEMCTVCKGWVYRRPAFAAADLEKIAKQICEMEGLPGGLHLRVRHYEEAGKCQRADAAKV